MSLSGDIKISSLCFCGCFLFSADLAQHEHLNFLPPCLQSACLIHTNAWLHPFIPLSVSFYFQVSLFEPCILSQTLSPSTWQGSFHPDTTFFSLGICLGQNKKVFLLLTWFMWLNFNALFCLKIPFLPGWKGAMRIDGI